MPRKTDGIEFEIHARPTKGEDGKPLLYVRPANKPERTFLPVSQYLSPCLQASFSLLQSLSFFVSHVLTFIVSFSFSKRLLFSDFFKYSKTAPKGCGLF